MGRKRPVILSDDDDDFLSGAADDEATQAQNTVVPPRASRKTKDSAKEKWKSLVPGQTRKKKPNSVAQDMIANHSKSPSKKHEVKDPQRTRHGKMPRAPRIDPNASPAEDDGLFEVLEKEDDYIHPVRGRKQRSPKVQISKGKTAVMVPAQDDIADDSQEDVADEHDDAQGSAVESESGDAEHTDDEDEGLKRMEKSSARALEEMFAHEAARWVEEDDDIELPPANKRSRSKSQSSGTQSRHHSSSRPPPSSRSPSIESTKPDLPVTQKDPRRHGLHSSIAPPRSVSFSGKKRAIEELSSDSENDNSPAPSPPKKQVKKSVAHLKVKGNIPVARTKSKPGQPLDHERVPSDKVSGTKRARMKREEEVPQIRTPDSEADKGIIGRKTHIKDGASKRTHKPKTKVEHIDLDSGDAESSDSDSQNYSIELVLPKRGKLKLSEQPRRVRRVLHRGIHILQTHLVCKNAFPDGPQKHGKIVHRALLKSAEEFAYADIVKRLKKEDEYAHDLSKIPAQRIAPFRGSVRKLVDGQAGTTFGMIFGDKTKGDWLQEGLRYIYPFNYENDSIEADKPYSRPVFVEILRAAFFKHSGSFGFEIMDNFRSTLDEKPDEKEIPAPMLALVATAIHAAIEDCKFGYTQPRNFTTNDYYSVYQDHIQELSAIRSGGPVQYHVLMHGLWRQIRNPIAGRGQPTGVPRKSFINVAAMARE